MHTPAVWCQAQHTAAGGASGPGTIARRVTLARPGHTWVRSKRSLPARSTRCIFAHRYSSAPDASRSPSSSPGHPASTMLRAACHDREHHPDLATRRLCLLASLPAPCSLAGLPPYLSMLPCVQLRHVPLASLHQFACVPSFPSSLCSPRQYRGACRSLQDCSHASHSRTFFKPQTSGSPHHHALVSEPRPRISEGVPQTSHLAPWQPQPAAAPLRW